MKINIDELTSKGACLTGVEIFREKLGNEIDLTESNFREVFFKIAGDNRIDWFVKSYLPEFYREWRSGCRYIDEATCNWVLDKFKIKYSDTGSINLKLGDLKIFTQYFSDLSIKLTKEDIEKFVDSYYDADQGILTAFITMIILKGGVVDEWNSLHGYGRSNKRDVIEFIWLHLKDKFK